MTFVDVRNDALLWVQIIMGSDYYGFRGSNLSTVLKDVDVTGPNPRVPHVIDGR